MSKQHDARADKIMDVEGTVDSLSIAKDMVKKEEPVKRMVAPKQRSWFERIFKRDAGPPKPKPTKSKSSKDAKPLPKNSKYSETKVPVRDEPGTMPQAEESDSDGEGVCATVLGCVSLLPFIICSGAVDQWGNQKATSIFPDSKEYREIPADVKHRAHEHILYLVQNKPSERFTCNVCGKGGAETSGVVPCCI
jgi:hypothetical protein